MSGKQTNTVYTRVLEDFGGLDTAHPPSGVAPNRFTKLENLWRDYAGGEGSLLETFPGFRCLATLSGAIHGVYRLLAGGVAYLFVHAGRRIYVAPFQETDGMTLATLTVVTGSAGKVADAPSVAFTFGEALYLLDGVGYYVIRHAEEGFRLSRVQNGYIPLTYLDGEPYEQRNLLSDYADVQYRVRNLGAFSHGTPELRYRVTSDADATCEVSGLADGYEGAVYVPSTVDIGGRAFRVTAVGKNAFAFRAVTHLYVSEGVETLGNYACLGSGAMTEVVLPDSMTQIGLYAFKNRPLTKLVLGAGLRTVREQAFASVTLGSVVCHGESGSYWEAVTVAAGNDVLTAATKSYVTTYPVQFCAFPLLDPVVELMSVTVDGTAVTAASGRYFTEERGGLVTGVILRSQSGEDLTGKLIAVRVRLKADSFRVCTAHPDVSGANPGYTGTASDAVAHTTLACLWDGRVFFAGNPALPNTVFYAGRDRSGAVNPAYVGVLNFWNAGEGQSPVTALLPTVSHLAVCKGGDGSEGSVLLYGGKDTDEDLLPRIYILRQTLAGNTCIGGALHFSGDPVYLSGGGVESIGCESLNASRVVLHRSTLIDAALAAKAGRKPLGAVVDGYYLLLYPDGEAYLADGRRRVRTAEGVEYEWYRLTGVGGYTGDLPVFRYAAGYAAGKMPTVTYGGVERTLTIHPAPGALPGGATEETYATVYQSVTTVTGEGGETFSYVAEGTEPNLYLVEKTGERFGGTFSAPTALSALGGKLFFGAANGQLFVVNTDKRRPGGGIPREYYSFGGHPYPAGFETGLDLCGVPNYTKRTVRNTAIAEMRAGAGTALDVRVSHGSYYTTERGQVATGDGIVFDALDFRTVGFGAGGLSILALRERSRKWVGKQYRMYVRAYASPIALHRIAYSWQVAGKVKNK